MRLFRALYYLRVGSGSPVIKEVNQMLLHSLQKTPLPLVEGTWKNNYSSDKVLITLHNPLNNSPRFFKKATPDGKYTVKIQF